MSMHSLEQAKQAFLSGYLHKVADDFKYNAADYKPEGKLSIQSMTPPDYNSYMDSFRGPKRQFDTMARKAVAGAPPPVKAKPSMYDTTGGYKYNKKDPVEARMAEYMQRPVEYNDPVLDKAPHGLETFMWGPTENETEEGRKKRLEEMAFNRFTQLNKAQVGAVFNPHFPEYVKKDLYNAYRDLKKDPANADITPEDMYNPNIYQQARETMPDTAIPSNRRETDPYVIAQANGLDLDRITHLARLPESAFQSPEVQARARAMIEVQQANDLARAGKILLPSAEGQEWKDITDNLRSIQDLPAIYPAYKDLQKTDPSITLADVINTYYKENQDRVEATSPLNRNSLTRQQFTNWLAAGAEDPHEFDAERARLQAEEDASNNQ